MPSLSATTSSVIYCQIVRPGSESGGFMLRCSSQRSQALPQNARQPQHPKHRSTIRRRCRRTLSRISQTSWNFEAGGCVGHQPTASRLGRSRPKGGQSTSATVPQTISIQSRSPSAASGGSSRPSFIIKADRTIVTNNHVVAGAWRDGDDGSESSERILGGDAATDIAVLKISITHPLPYLELGGSSIVRPGEGVIPMGNPLDSAGHRDGRDRLYTGPRTTPHDLASAVSTSNRAARCGWKSFATAGS